VAAGVALGSTACASGSEPEAAATSVPSASQPTTAVPRTSPSASAADPSSQDATAVTVAVDQVEVRDSPAGATVHTLPRVRESGTPQTFLLDLDPGGQWLRVKLPVRPNGSTGWVRRGDVTLSAVGYRLEMSTATNRLTLLEDGDVVDTFEAASGTGNTPTPLGSFYLVELLRPTNDGYGPYAYGLSGFSEVLSDFGGGPGQIGLHGTDDPDSIGRAASHGCIRLSDPDITMLAELLPLGTPIDIT